jgi:2-oxoglutarate ferredoxin oxidoreductase subunit gamma
LHYDIVFAGIGGQGVLFIGTLLASAAVKEGKEVVYTPHFIGQMRGNISTCMVNIDSEPIFSPVVTQYDIVVTLHQSTLETFEPKVKQNGLLLWESSIIKEPPQRRDIRIYDLPAYNKALELLGNTDMMNMLILGALIKIDNIVKQESIIAALHETIAADRRHLVPQNEKAFTSGMNLI